jgi:asparagine synthase (glutamine-hydrolysing)
MEVRATGGHGSVHIANEDHWTESGGVAVVGNAFVDGELHSAEGLAERVKATDTVEQLEGLLSRANGLFSLVYDTGDAVHVAVDHVRSWPVFYAATDDAYVSDSAEWVRDAGARRGYDPRAGDEYLFTCFVTGWDTLSRDVKQVRAGEIVSLYRGRSETDVRRRRYFDHAPAESSRDLDRDELDAATVAAIQRLIDYADGRTILLGLSGGYDSRLIALVLRRLGHENTVTYTTQTASASSAEMERARTIAEDLGFEHIAVTSSRADYSGIEGSEQMALAEDIGYLSEYPHINKVVLRRKLRDAGIDPGEVVHVLGHTLLGSGTFLPDWVRDRETIRREEFLDLLWELHYTNWETTDEPWRRELFEARILDRCDRDLYRDGDVESTADAVAGFEQWYWQERLPKYIIARREYEWLGFDVWYPLLDRELYAFFAQSGYRDRVGKRALKAYVRDLDEQVRGKPSDLREDDGGASTSVTGTAWSAMVDLVYALPDPVKESVRRLYNEHRRKNAYDRDPRYGIVSRDRFESIQFPNVDRGAVYRTLLLLYLYDEGYFEFPVETEFDRALD